MTVTPVPRLSRMDLLERGEIATRRALARVSNLSPRIADRELAAVGKSLSWDARCLEAEQVQGAIGPGNVLTVELVSENITELFTGFGRREASAEQVAEDVVEEVKAYLASGAPVGPYLADQLLVPLAIAGGGSFRTVRPTRHTLTNIEIVRSFLDIDIVVHKEDRGVWRIAVDGPEAREANHEG